MPFVLFFGFILIACSIFVLQSKIRNHLFVKRVAARAVLRAKKRGKVYEKNDERFNRYVTKYLDDPIEYRPVVKGVWVDDRYQ